MQSVFISKLKPFLDAVAESVTGGELYVPKKTGEPRPSEGLGEGLGEHYVYSKYDPSSETAVEYNNIRTCTPVKEFLFPLCELAAVFPEPVEPEEVKPFAVFGLKDCDLRSIEILDKVFLEADFRDPLYAARRGNMFIISTDCFDPGESCFCNILNGQPFAQGGFDLNVSQVKDGFVIEPGSQNGKDFIEKHSDIFSDVPQGLLAERDENRTRTQNKLQQQNAEFQFDATVREVVESCQDSDIFDAEAQDCVECQGCTRVCPTCHCFYLYDTKQKDYFAKMKMWDSCMRRAYAEVAGGANPRRILGDRIKHRLLHKFVYFLDRYGIDMCVGCGRCIDACAGGIDTRAILKKLNDQLLDKPKAKVAK